MHPFLKFSVLLSTVLMTAFGCHILILYLFDLSLFDNLIIEAYLMNGVLALTIYLLLYRLRNKMSEQLGFLFMGGSFVKFLCFFIFFYPSYKMDGRVDSLEFAAFFTPYAISLIFETLGVMKFLKK